MPDRPARNVASRASPSSAPASSASASPGGWPRAALSVTVFDQGAAGAGASHAAAGMLAACAEAEPGEEALVALGRDSQARWPAFAAELQAGLRHRRGVAHRRHAGRRLDRRRPGAAASIISSSSRSSACRCNGFRRRRRAGASRISPASSPARCAARRTTQVDNRKLAAALRIAAEAAGATIREHHGGQGRSRSRAGRVDGIVLADGTKIAADVVVLAAGAWSRSIDGLAPELRPPVRPIKGQMLALRMDPAAPLIDPRGLGAGRLSGAAPGWPPARRRDRRGEGLRHHRSPPAACSRCSKRPGGRCPAIEELPIDEMWVGHRPGSRDDAPILGPGRSTASSTPPAITATAFC